MLSQIYLLSKWNTKQILLISLYLYIVICFKVNRSQLIPILSRMRCKVTFQLVISPLNVFVFLDSSFASNEFEVGLSFDHSERVWCRIVFVCSAKNLLHIQCERWKNGCICVIFFVVHGNLKLCNNGNSNVEGKHFGTGYRKCYSIIEVTWTASEYSAEYYQTQGKATNARAKWTWEKIHQSPCKCFCNLFMLVFCLSALSQLWKEVMSHNLFFKSF